MHITRSFGRTQIYCSGVFSWRRVFLLVYLVVVFGPILALGSEAVREIGTGERWSSLVIPAGRRLVLLLNSLGLAAVVAAGGLLLGVLAASLAWRWGAHPFRHLRWLLLALICLPPYAHALAWSTFAALGQSSGAGTLLRGWPASAWVQTMALAPLGVGMAMVGLASVDQRLVEASRMLRADLYTLWRVVLPLAAPIILAGGSFLFLLSLVDYSVPSLFQRNVYALEVFADYSASNNAGHALLISLPLLLVAVLAVLASQSGLVSVAQTPLRSSQSWNTAPHWPWPLTVLQWASMIVLMLQLGVPLFVLLRALGAWRDLITTVALARSEIAYTFWISAVTAIASLPLAAAIASEFAHRKARVRLWWLLITIPLAVPAPLVGIGLVVIWNRPLPVDIYGSRLMPVLASLARFMPLAAILLHAQWRRIDPLLIDAARTLQTSARQTWMQVRLPMLAPGLIAAAGLVFALTAGELGATLIVAPPGQATLTMRIYNYMHYGASADVAGLSLMLTGLALAAGGLSVLALTGWSRLLPGTGSGQ